MNHADEIVLGVHERDANDDAEDDDDDEDDDNDGAFDDYFDYDTSFHTPEWDDERHFIVIVQNGTVTAWLESVISDHGQS